MSNAKDESEFLDDLDDEVSKPDSFVCDVCGYKAKNLAGLAGHKRLAHQKPTKQNGYKNYVDDVLDRQGETYKKFSEEVIAKVIDATKLLAEALKENESSLMKYNQEQNSKLQVLDEKIIALGRIIEGLGNTIIQINSGAKWCVDDIKAFKKVGINPKPFTLENSKKE